MRKSLSGKLAATIGVGSLAALVGSARAGNFAHITVDGDVSDWAGIQPSYTDPAGDNTTTNASGQIVDFTNVYIANDDNYVYFRFQLAQPANPNTYQTNYFIDGDHNSSTGFGPGQFGSELLIQGNGAYQEAGGGFNEGLLGTKDGAADSALPAGVTDTIGLQIATFGVSGTDGFEFRISRNAMLAYTGSNGVNYANQKVFSNLTSFNLTLETDPGPADIAGPISYDFAPDPSPVPEPTSLAMIGALATPLLVRRRRGSGGSR